MPFEIKKMIKRKDPSENAVEMLYGIMRLFHMSWGRLMETPLPTLNLMLKQLEKEERRMKREQNKLRRHR